MTSSGELSLTGRAKDTIVLLSGENVDPEPLENALTCSPWIDQAVVVGQDQKFLAALIVAPDDRRVESRDLETRIRQEIDRCVSPRKGFRQHERIVRFSLLEKALSVEEDLLSPTLKVKRQRVQERFSKDIARLYGDRVPGASAR